MKKKLLKINWRALPTRLAGLMGLDTLVPRSRRKDISKALAPVQTADRVQTSARPQGASATKTAANGMHREQQPGVPHVPAASARVDHAPSAFAKKAAINERQRCKRIVQYGLDNRCLHQACVLAFNSELSASVAISALSANEQNRGSRSSLQARMEMYQAASNQTSGQDKGGAPGPEDLAKEIVATASKLRGSESRPQDTVGALMGRASRDLHTSAAVAQTPGPARAGNEPDQLSSK